MALVPNDQGPPWYRETDEPECGETTTRIDEWDPLECNLVADHDGNHVEVIDPWDGYGVGWER